MSEIADPNQVILLLASAETIKEQYFKRDDKQDMYNCIMSMPDPNESLENVKNSLIYSKEPFLKQFYDSGFKCILRDSNSTKEKTLKEIESHFKLI